MTDTTKKTVKTEEQAPEKKKSVVSGTVMERKPSTVKRISSLFFQASPEEVAQNVVKNVILPDIKYLLNNIWKRTGEIMFWGVDGRAPRRGRDDRYRDYNSISSRGQRDRAFQNESKRDDYSRVDSYKDLIFDNKDDPERIILELQEEIIEYDEAKVARILEECGKTPDPHHFEWGWTNLDDADVEMTPVGWWYLVLPRMKRL